MFVTISHYLAVAVAELDYFETCGFLLLRHNADNILQTCFHALCHVVCSSVFDSFFCLLRNSLNLDYFSDSSYSGVGNYSSDCRDSSVCGFSSIGASGE